MKVSRLHPIIRLPLVLFCVVSLAACSSADGTGDTNENINANGQDATGFPGEPAPDPEDNTSDPSDLGEGQAADTPTFGKDGEGAAEQDDAASDGETSDGPDEDAQEAPPEDGGESPVSDTEEVDPADSEEPEPSDAEASEEDVAELSDAEESSADAESSDSTDPTPEGDADTGPSDEEDVDEEPVEPELEACDEEAGCEEQDATRCAADGSALIQQCKSVGGCLKWIDSEYCQFDEFFPNACTGKADICVDGACVPDGDALAGCPSSDNACEEAACDGATGECSIVMVEPGTPCDDGDVCTKSDICFGNECIGTGTDALGSPICPQDCLDTGSALECGDFASFELSGETGTSLIDEYSCGGAVGYTGYETAFLVEAPNLAYEMPLTLAVELADPALKGEAFADIVVLNSSPGYQCWANECVAVGYMDESGVATVELPAFVDEDDDPSNDASYIVLVDGRDGFNGAVRLSSWCIPGYTDIELYCTDGKDDDADGMVDCEDPSCWDSLTCLFEHDCDNGSDDDDDGAVDCADDDCAEHPDCYIEANCDDGQDDEGDGLTDCEDDDCEFTPECSDSCEDAIPLSCGDILSGQDPKTGTNTFSAFPCSPSGINTDSQVYESTHHVYHVQADEGCAARVRVSPESDDFIILDIYAMGPGCTADHCIEVEGGAQCQNPQTPASVFGGDACVQIPESFAQSSWVTVIPDNAFVDSSADLSYGLEVICDCQ